MAALTSGSWTISFRRDRSMDTVIVGKKKYVDLKFVLASGEVASGGVTLPGAGSVGLVRNLDHYIFYHDLNTVNFTTAAARAVKWVLNATGNKLVAFKYVLSSGAASPSGGRTLRALPTAQTIPSNTFYVTAVGW